MWYHVLHKQSIRTELVPSMAYVSAFIAFVRVPPQIKSNPKDICEQGRYCCVVYDITLRSVPFNSRDVSHVMMFWISVD
jgi:hypothetical protein